MELLRKTKLEPPESRGDVIHCHSGTFPQWDVVSQPLDGPGSEKVVRKHWEQIGLSTTRGR